ncbi:hypothetical protein [Paracraurococcus ruber]|uniref:Uncharacterized protein n=1 Tax=Paracraurococcus ruber TaxID=77675 RepID=A0ABS1CYI3_9PROT|nr:hypothetical protein [Paracraurococcus ruber]MBK1659588.1 hypothetical protein [Paracraurococcus ruber]TDG28765.1 hypothetical protein E2C05_19670 [Paracraurococcus ruber]
MSRIVIPRLATLALLSTGLALGGCTGFNNSTGGLTDGIGRVGERLGAPWGGPTAQPPAEQSTTVARIAGMPMAVETLRSEDGDVWPVPEGPRSTLANPDAAMRNIPNYQPSELDRPSRPAGRSQWQPTDPDLPPGLRGSSSPPPPPIRQPEIPPPQAVAPLPPGLSAPPGRRPEGQVITTPSGPALTTGGTDRVQSFITPGGGTGTAIRDGNTTTLIGPNGQVQTVPSR